jgi:hypothetical protein
VNRAGSIDYYLERIFAESPVVLSQKVFWIPSLRDSSKLERMGVDLCIAILPLRCKAKFEGIYDFCGPRSVKQVLDTTGNWEDVKKRFNLSKRNKANRIQKGSEFSYRISREPHDLDFFYHRMFKPHIQKQFGAYASIESLEEMRRSLESGFLLFILLDGEPVAASLCAFEGKELAYRRSGVLDGDERHIKRGVQTAIYYFQIKLANEKGLESVNFMESKAYLNDGVYRVKREWGAKVSPASEANVSGIIAYFIPRPSEMVAKFFEQNPAFVYSAKGLMGAVGSTAGFDASAERKKELNKAFYAPGIKGLLIVSPDSKIPAEVLFEP